MPTATSQTMVRPNGWVTSSPRAPLPLTEPSRSPRASWIDNHAMSRCTTP